MQLKIRASCICMCCLSLFCIRGEAFCQKKISFGFDAHLGRTSGTTQYNIFASDYSDELQAAYDIESELVFPANFVLAGLTAAMRYPINDRKSWQLNLSILKDMSKTSGSMRDTDWVRIPTLRFDEVVSYTESSAKLASYAIEMNGRFGSLLKGRLKVDGILGYRYLNDQYTIRGAEGWQYDDFGNRVNILLRGEVLKYEVRKHIPYLGLAASIPLSQRLSLSAEYDYSPITSAKDFDDHLLRKKTAEGDCTGQSHFGFFQARILLNTNEKNGQRVYLGVDFVISTISTMGEQTQRFYGNDPGTPEDETGLLLSGIDQEITRKQNYLGVTLSADLN